MSYRIVLPLTVLAAWGGFLAYSLVHTGANDPAMLIASAAADPGGTISQAYLTMLDAVLLTAFGVALVRSVAGRGSTLAIAAAVLFSVGNLGHTTEAVLNFMWWAMAQPDVDQSVALKIVDSMATYVLPLVFLSPVSIIVGVSCALASLARAGRVPWALAAAYPILAVVSQVAPVPGGWPVIALIMTVPIVATACVLGLPQSEPRRMPLATAV